MSTSWGNERGALFHRGVVLHPRGTAQDEVQREMVRRERREKVAFARFLARLAQAAFRVPTEVLEPMFKDYAETVFHESYSRPPKPRTSPKQKENQDLLAKVDKLTVADEDLPKPPAPRRGRAGRR